MKSFFTLFALTLYTWILTAASRNVTHLTHQNCCRGRFPLLFSSSLHHPFHFFHSLHPSPICVSAVWPFYPRGLRRTHDGGSVRGKQPQMRLIPTWKNMDEMIRAVLQRPGTLNAPFYPKITQPQQWYSDCCSIEGGGIIRAASSIYFTQCQRTMVTGRSTASISDSRETLLRTLERMAIRFSPGVFGALFH